MNYKRYAGVRPNRYLKRDITYYAARKSVDAILLSRIADFKDKIILEVGIGTGYYTGFMLAQKNRVIGVDINPHLGEGLPVEIIEASADDFSRKLSERFDVVASFWMTEYLDPRELAGFIRESFAVLKPGGRLVTTIVADRGLGSLYILGARLKGIEKYNYSKSDIIKAFAAYHTDIQPLPGAFNLPFGYLVTAAAI